MTLHVPPQAVCALPSQVLSELRAQAHAAYPEECCGLLIGRRERERWTIERLVPSANVAPPPRHKRFEIDPAILLRVHREARDTGEDAIGHYHSHPDGRPIPSADDARRACQPNQIWLVLAVDAAGRCAVGAWLRGGGSEAAFTALRLVELFADGGGAAR